MSSQENYLDSPLTISHDFTIESSNLNNTCIIFLIIIDLSQIKLSPTLRFPSKGALAMFQIF